MAGYEDANDSNVLRHDPIFKIACERLPLPSEELTSDVVAFLQGDIKLLLN